MTSESVHQSISPIQPGERPRVTSYDSGYEHSLEHWFEVQQLVEAADEERSAPAPLAAAS